MTRNGRCGRALLEASIGLLVLVTAWAPARAEPGVERQAELIGCLWFVAPAPKQEGFNLNSAELDAIESLGMRLVVLNGPWIGQHGDSSGEDDPTELLFAEGDRRRLEFYVDTGAMASWWLQPDATEELARAGKRIEHLQRQYGHHRSFKGFYVPYETYVMWGAQRELARGLYRKVAAACKTAAPSKQVMVSPFFLLDDQQLLGDYRFATPSEYEEFWTEVLRDSAIDIVSLQDRGEHLSYFTDEQCAPFFAAMKRACDATGTELWANVETGELAVDSSDDYVAKFGRKTHVNDPRTEPFWRGVPAKKLAAKLRLVGRYTPTAITWGYREFIRPSADDKSEGLFQEYQKILAP